MICSNFRRSIVRREGVRLLRLNITYPKVITFQVTNYFLLFVIKSFLVFEFHKILNVTQCEKRALKGTGVTLSKLHYLPSEKGARLVERICSSGAIFFPFRERPFQKRIGVQESRQEITELL